MMFTNIETPTNRIMADLPFRPGRVAGPFFRPQPPRIANIDEYETAPYRLWRLSIGGYVGSVSDRHWTFVQWTKADRIDALFGGATSSV